MWFVIADDMFSGLRYEMQRCDDGWAGMQQAAYFIRFATEPHFNIHLDIRSGD